MHSYLLARSTSHLGEITVFPSSSNTTLLAIKRGACGNARRFLLLILPLRHATRLTLTPGVFHMVAAAILVNEKTLRTRLATFVRRREAVRAR